MKEKILSLNQIKLDETIYPRALYYWQTAYEYSEAIKAGAKFPPITVAKIKNLHEKYFLIDGRHRLEAIKMNKGKYISAEILKEMTKDQAYVEAIKRNIIHGKRFNVSEKARIIAKLEDLNYKPAEISKLVQIPAEKLSTFVASRMTYDMAGEKVILKSPLRHLAGKNTNKNIEYIQAPISSGQSQIKILNDLINLLENNLIDKKNKQVKIRLKRISVLINKTLKKR